MAGGALLRELDGLEILDEVGVFQIEIVEEHALLLTDRKPARSETHPCVVRGWGIHV